MVKDEECLFVLVYSEISSRKKHYKLLALAGGVHPREV